MNSPCKRAFIYVDISTNPEKCKVVCANFIFFRKKPAGYMIFAQYILPVISGWLRGI
jgi:hypothetical protein